MTITRPVALPPADRGRSAPPSRFRGSNQITLSSRSILAAFEQLDRRPRHDGRNRVLVDKLRMAVAPQQQAEIVEPGDNSLQLHSVDQKDRQGRFGFANVIKEGVL